MSTSIITGVDHLPVSFSFFLLIFGFPHDLVWNKWLFVG